MPKNYTNERQKKIKYAKVNLYHKRYLYTLNVLTDAQNKLYFVND